MDPQLGATWAFCPAPIIQSHAYEAELCHYAINAMHVDKTVLVVLAFAVGKF